MYIYIYIVVWFNVAPDPHGSATAISANTV